MGGNTNQLPRKGILMLVKITRRRFLPTRASVRSATPGDPLDEFQKREDEAVRRFRSEPVTPQRFLELENELKAAAEATCRAVLEQEVNRLEPEDKRALP